MTSRRSMTAIAAAALLPLLATTAAASATGAGGHHPYVHYRNARFGFRLLRPAWFHTDRPPTDGDGQEWSTERGRVTLVAFGANNVTNETPRQDEKADEHGLRVTYESISGQVVTVSGIEHKTRIVYRHDVVGQGSIDGLEWTYPKLQKHRWDKPVVRTEQSFHPGDVSVEH